MLRGPLLIPFPVIVGVPSITIISKSIVEKFTVTTDAGHVELAFQSLVDDGFMDHPTYGQFGRRYYPAALGDTWNDTSFAVYRGESPILIAICGSSGGPICYFGMPMRIWTDKTLGARRFNSALGKSFDHLASLAAANGTTACIIRDDPSGSSASFLGRFLHAAGAVPRIGLCTRIDLGAPREVIAANVRKSYRSLISRGKRSISLTYANRNNPDSRMFDQYREFHQRIAGRVTRPRKSWDIMFEAIAGGHGELSLGHDSSGDLISATLVIDGGEVAQYSSGVYEREQFDKPLGHWPLYDAILRAKARGRSLFDLGDIPAAGTATHKEVSIGAFKRGFAGRLDFRLAWHMPLAEAGCGQ